MRSQFFGSRVPEVFYQVRTLLPSAGVCHGAVHISNPFEGTLIYLFQEGIKSSY